MVRIPGREAHARPLTTLRNGEKFIGARDQSPYLPLGAAPRADITSATGRRSYEDILERAELRSVQKAVALALREEGKTQQQVARLLGVARQTVGFWLDTTNANDGDGCNHDSRQKATKEQRQRLARCNQYRSR